MKNLHAFSAILRKEHITQHMLAEWTDISYGRIRYILYGHTEFRLYEKKKICDVFMGKYLEEELFGA